MVIFIVNYLAHATVTLHSNVTTAEQSETKNNVQYSFFFKAAYSIRTLKLTVKSENMNNFLPN